MNKPQMPDNKTALPHPTKLSWHDYRRAFQWKSPAENRNGMQRMEYPDLPASDFGGRLIVLPPGQACPQQTEPGDVVLLCAQGEIEVSIGGDVKLLKQYDLIGIPAGAAYQYLNVALDNAVIFKTFAYGDTSNPTPTPASAVTYMPFQSYRRDFRWTLPLAERWGYHRGSGPLIIMAMLRGHLVRQPPAQTTPWHYAPRDMMFITFAGETEFAAAGEKWPLKPFDILTLPAATPYTYTNFGLSEAVFFSIGGKLPPGKKGVYFESDPGWPIRSDVKTLDIEIDPYGDAKIRSGK